MTDRLQYIIGPHGEGGLSNNDEFIAEESCNIALCHIYSDSQKCVTLLWTIISGVSAWKKIEYSTEEFTNLQLYTN